MGLPSLSSNTEFPTALRMTPNPMRCASRAVVATMIAPLNAGVVHEIHLDVTHAPVVHQGRISLAQIFLCSGIGGIERIKLVFVLGDVAQVNRLAAGVV